MKLSNPQIMREIEDGCTETEFLEKRCPRCGAELMLSVHPKGGRCFVRCTADSTHFAMHGETCKAPEWWERYKGAGWISELIIAEPAVNDDP